ncbi:MAG: urease accessory UreF family protein [Pseudomonadota bacterium]|nr:urease accessory UreF family protein [Pseudomonadota bacterium]
MITTMGIRTTTITAMTMITVTPTDLCSPALLQMAQVVSPAFPVGSFSYSGGIEAAVARRMISGPEELQGWLGTVLETGGLWTDAVLMAAAYRDEDVADLALALIPAAPRRQEALETGQALVRHACQLWPVTVSEAAYPVALGQLGKAMDWPLVPLLQLHLQAQISNMVINATRVMALGQARAQGMISDLSEQVLEVASKAAMSTVDDLGGFAPLADVAAQSHETLGTRIFRS